MHAEKGYWHAMHQKAVTREAILKEELAQLRAKLRLRERQLFGRKSEKGKNPFGNGSLFSADMFPGLGCRPKQQGNPFLLSLFFL